MNIELYDNILNQLKQYNNDLQKNYGNIICKYAPTKEPTFPVTIFTEIANNEISGHSGKLEKCSQIGFQLDIYSKTKGSVDKVTIGRFLAKELDTFMTDVVCAKKMSYNVFDIGDDVNIYRIVITYNVDIIENRKLIYRS